LTILLFYTSVLHIREVLSIVKGKKKPLLALHDLNCSFPYLQHSFFIKKKLTSEEWYFGQTLNLHPRKDI